MAGRAILFILLIFSACAEKSKQMQQDNNATVLTNAEQITANLGKPVEIRGKLLNAKLAPLIQSPAGPIHLMGDYPWVERHMGQTITVKGELGRLTQNEPLRDKDGAYRAGFSGSALILKNATLIK